VDKKTGIIIFIFMSLIFTSFNFITEGFSQTREEATTDSKEYIKTNPEPRSSESAKIHSKIIEWKNSSNPEAFARDNNIVFSDNKIQVYIYLDSANSIANIPQNIDVIGSDDNIVVAFVNSKQINQLAQLDFVEQISPPITAVPRETQREPTEITPKLDDPKINSVILEWMSSSNLKSFAEDNSLIFSDNKIQVYVYLDSANSIANIPQNIDVIGSDDNIVVAFVNSEQINQLAQLDFVEQISPPIRATIPPIPISQEGDEIENYALIGIGIVIIVAIIVGGVYSMKRKEVKINNKD